jgi:cephalosporin hydroxylase
MKKSHLNWFEVLLALFILILFGYVFVGGGVPNAVLFPVLAISLIILLLVAARRLQYDERMSTFSMIARLALFLILGVVVCYTAFDSLIIRRFNQLSYYAAKPGANIAWMGIPSQQNPADNWVMQEIIYETKPDLIIESGTANGGTTLYYAMVLDQVNRNGKIITIDIAPMVEVASQQELFQRYVESIKSDSVDPNLIETLKNRSAGRKVLVTLDSLHTRDHVLKELQLYAPLVSKGSYLVVQDTNINGHPVLPHYGPGPMEALRDFLKQNNDFQVDRSKEKFLQTHYPMGYLKRIR